MRSFRFTLLLVCGITLLSAAPVSARKSGVGTRYRPHQSTGTVHSLDVPLDAAPLYSAAVQGTTWLATYTFDSGGSCVEEGWVGIDLTAQLDDFWHVDDFVDMGPYYHGRVGVLSGSQSLWCGVRASEENPFCGYVILPGYGNSWTQGFCTTDCVNTGPGATVTFDADWESEPGYDYTALQVSNCTGGVSDEVWVTIDGGINVWDGFADSFTQFGDTSMVISIPDSLHGPGGSNPLRIRFYFESDGAWSDEDGLFDTDGAFVLDNLSLTGLSTETFEGEDVGDTATLSGNWSACTPPGYGDFSGLFTGLTQVQEDPCVNNLTCMWAFISGSTYDYACGGYPGQAAVPYENIRGQYLNNEIWSPVIPLVGSGVRFEYVFDVYRDLPVDPLVFYVWHIRSYDASGCPSGWADRAFVEFGPGQDWFRSPWAVGDLIEAGAVSVQLAFGAIDMCPFWCGSVGTGECHSHAPLFDNVAFYRIESQGPQWSVRDIDLFQDTFATDGTTTGTARIDAAIDILPSHNANFRPGDSTTVRVSDPDYGLALDGTGWAAVYAWVNVGGPSAAAVDASPGMLTADPFRWPFTSSATDANGATWHIVRMDTSFTDGVARTGPGPDAFCIDLNDNLFVPGDTIRFIFAATSAGPGNTTTYWFPTYGSTPDQNEALANPEECTILPAGALAGGSDHILYVDGMNWRGAQPFFDATLQSWGIDDLVDRYDIRGPSSNVANRPGARVVDPLQQVLPHYRAIIWSTGNLHNGLIGDGTTQIEKSNDAQMLLTFLDNLTIPGGIYFSGDNIAEEWTLYSGAAIPLRDTYIQHSLVNADHVNQGFMISPLVIGEPGGLFDHITGPDTMVVLGGCPLVSDFDVMAPTALSTQEMRYDGGSPGANGAVISQFTLNPDSVEVGVILCGFSLHVIRDDRPRGDMDRVVHLYDALVWFSSHFIGTPATPTFRNVLTQNYPNPFNPTTTIEFSVRELAPVTVTIYNVRGQRVRVLANERFEPGVTHRLTWNGTNDSGQAVASGVYFYRMVTKGFTQTRKMVMLK